MQAEAFVKLSRIQRWPSGHVRPSQVGRHAGPGMVSSQKKPSGQLDGLFNWQGRPHQVASAQQSRLTGIVGFDRDADAAAPLFLCPRRNAVAHQRAVFTGLLRLAGKALRALPVRFALTVRAVEPPITVVEQTTQRRFTISLVEARAVVGLKAQPLLVREHGADGSPPHYWRGRPREHSTHEDAEREAVGRSSPPRTPRSPRQFTRNF